MDMTPLKLVKAGFWLAIGFLVPFYLAYFAYYKIYYYLSNPEAEMYSYKDYTDQVTVAKYEARRNGNRLLVLGDLHNDAEVAMTSVTVEVELFDANNNFVYECSDYISEPVAAGATEHFQVSCGCGENAAPEYASMTVRVTEAKSGGF